MFKSPGFTLLELAITLAILMIMATIALPLYHQFMASVELKNSSRLLTIHIQKAKYDAILRHKSVVLCPSVDLSTCNSNWDTSLISFVDTNQNLQRENNEEVLTNVEFASLRFFKISKVWKKTK